MMRSLDQQIDAALRKTRFGFLQQAFDILSGGSSYAVIVSDLKMPNMNGIEFLSEMRRTCPQTIRILLSGNAETNQVDDALIQGVIQRHVQKPCPLDEMTRILGEAQALWRASQESGS